MFYKARVKLTLWYVLMIMIISIFFSAAIYQIQINELRVIESRQKARINRQIEMRDMAPLILELSFIDEARKHLTLNLMYLNGVILAMSGIFAWVLSGKTLNPIHAMMIEQSRFISDASHELKTPLTSLKTAFEVFDRSKKSTLKDARIIIKESMYEVNRLQKLTESLLELALLQKPLPDQLFEDSLITNVLESAIKKTKTLAKKKSIAITLEKSSDASAEIVKDEITNLFVILLENAIKYSPKKSSITLSVEKSRTFVIIKVRDTGVGIAKKDLPHIFDRFYRADDARTYADASGYGLGLSIAQHMVKKHRGTISVESTVKKGSTFTVRLPKKRILS
jgi:signal transduction histidine kinase